MREFAQNTGAFNIDCSRRIDAVSVVVSHFTNHDSCVKERPVRLLDQAISTSAGLNLISLVEGGSFTGPC